MTVGCKACVMPTYNFPSLMIQWLCISEMLSSMLVLILQIAWLRQDIVLLQTSLYVSLLRSGWNLWARIKKMFSHPQKVVWVLVWQVFQQKNLLSLSLFQAWMLFVIYCKLLHGEIARTGRWMAFHKDGQNVSQTIYIDNFCCLLFWVNNNK